MHADLIELAGIGAVLERALQKFAQDESEQALHLLDIIFTVEPAHKEAVTLSIQIHERLLREDDNFWLTGWLKNQIKLLKGGVTSALSFR